jgi:tRNA-2-methylthio-N6-dimethylallyladenosine synthase
MTDDLLDAVRDVPKAAKYLHVPAQSGSDAVLRRMKRGYTVDDYRKMHDRIRDRLPEAAVTSDFIVGFCGETEADFGATCELVRDCRFKNSFIFKYSARPGTKGAELYADDVAEDVKRRRNNELLAIQNAISEADNHDFLGRQVEVLVEGPSKAAARRHDGGGTPEGPPPGVVGDASQLRGSPRPSQTPGVPHMQLVGRTMCDRIVVFEGNERQAGHIVPVSIYDANAHTLFGAIVTQHVGPEVFSLVV